MPWHKKPAPPVLSPSLDVTVNMQNSANDKQPVTVLIVQPVDQKDFVTANYGSLTQNALDQNVSRYIFVPDQMGQKVTIDVNDAPIAIYFILKRQPVSGWKYYIDKPRGKKLSFTIDRYDIKMGQ